SLAYLLKPLDEVVDFRLRPAIAVVPEIQQSVSISRNPIDDERRELTESASRQAVRHHNRRIRNRYRKARLRPAGTDEVFDTRAVRPHGRRDKDRASNPRLRARQVGHLD